MFNLINANISRFSQFMCHSVFYIETTAKYYYVHNIIATYIHIYTIIFTSSPDVSDTQLHPEGSYLTVEMYLP